MEVAKTKKAIRSQSEFASSFERYLVKTILKFTIYIEKNGRHEEKNRETEACQKYFFVFNFLLKLIRVSQENNTALDNYSISFASEE